MRDFAAKMWSPEGARPHVLAQSDRQGRRIGDWLLGRGGSTEAAERPLDAWHPQWETILRPVPRSNQHLTLGWVDIPSAQTEPGSLTALQQALRAALEQFPDVVLHYTTVVASVHGIHLRPARTPELDQLAAVVADVLRTIYDPGAVRTPDLDSWVPHIALAYGGADIDTPPLEIDLQPSSDPVHHIECFDYDTWALGWPAHLWPGDFHRESSIDIDTVRSHDYRLRLALQIGDDPCAVADPSARLPSPLPPRAIRIG